MLSKYRNSILAVLAFLFLLLLSYLGCFSSPRDVSPEVFIQQAVARVQSQAKENAAEWRLGKEEQWVANPDTGRITFMFADGTSVSAPMQIIGTYNIADGTFQWAWGHPGVKESLREHAGLARSFGQDHELLNYTQPTVSCTGDEAWAFTATAAKLGNASGAYESETGNTIVFMTFGEVSLSK